MLKSIHLSENTKELPASSREEESGMEKIIMNTNQNTDKEVLTENEVDHLQQTDNESEMGERESHKENALVI